MDITILQGLKKIKHLDRKIDKNYKRIQRWCSHLDNEEPLYDVEKLIQSVNDMTEEKDKLRHALHKTNIQTTIEFNGVMMSIDSLIILSTLTISAKINVLKSLRRREKQYGENEKDLKVIMNYDPKVRDKKIDALENFKDQAEELLDTVNITTKLIL